MVSEEVKQPSMFIHFSLVIALCDCNISTSVITRPAGTSPPLCKKTGITSVTDHHPSLILPASDLFSQLVLERIWSTNQGQRLLLTIWRSILQDLGK